ncbi:MAG TPA: hypothetical protein VHG08_22060 [Longimicrobium sp.]|nr:hypothetical protein [Longimicrobium sp.]
MVLERIGVRAPAPAPAAAAPAAAELGDDELEQVVGGLERIYVPGTVVAADF